MAQSEKIKYKQKGNTQSSVENFTDGPGDRGHSEISVLKMTLYF